MATENLSKDISVFSPKLPAYDTENEPNVSNDISPETSYSPVPVFTTPLVEYPSISVALPPFAKSAPPGKTVSVIFPLSVFAAEPLKISVYSPQSS